MPEFLALDWETHQLSGLEATVTRQGATIHKAFVLTWPDDIDLNTDADRAARWLKSELERVKVSARNVLLSLPRESTIVRRLTVPNAPDDELPALVRMQAATKSSTPLDQLELDFLPQPMGSPGVGREVLMCTMPRKRLAQMRAIFEGAGLELQTVGISGVASVELIAHEERHRKLDSAEASLIIARHGHRVEISILQQQHVIFTHSTQIHGDEEHPWGDESVIVAEVQRSLVSLHPQSGKVTIERAWLVGESDAVLAKAIENRLKCETIAFNPELATGLTNQAREWPSPIAAFAGPAGLLLANAEPQVGGIDFQNPRKPRPRRDMQKIRMLAGLATAAVVLIAMMGYRWWKVADLQEEITTKRNHIAELKQSLKAGEPTLKSAGLIAEWTLGAEKELGQIGRLHSALPGTDLIYLVKYKLTQGSRNSLAAIEAVGRAKDEADVRELFSKLAQRGIKVMPSNTEESTDSDYPIEFTLDLELPLPTAATTSPKPLGRT